MKRLTPYLLLAFLGAGCLSSSDVTPAPITETQVPATSTAAQMQIATTTQAQAIPGTEDWLEYKNYAYGFGFKYPSGSFIRDRIDTATGTILTIDLGSTSASTTAVATPDAKLTVMIISQDGKDLPPGGNLKDGCYDEMEGQGIQTTPKVSYGGQDVCITSGAGAGAGNFYHSDWYTVPLGDKYLVLTYLVHSVNCGNYEHPEQCIGFDESRDTLDGKLIMSTLSLFRPVALGQDWPVFQHQETVKGNKSYNLDFNYPSLTADKSPRAKAVDAAIQAYVSTTTGSFLENVKANADYPGPGPFTLDMDYAVPFVSDKLIEVVFEGYEFTGGAHGMQLYKTMVFDAATGKHLALNDFFQDQGNYLQPISDYAVQDLTKRSIGDAGWIKSGAAPEMANYTYYYWTKDGLVIIFPPYQVAPYAEGAQTVTVPYDKLPALVSEYSGM